MKAEPFEEPVVEPPRAPDSDSERPAARGRASSRPGCFVEGLIAAVITYVSAWVFGPNVDMWLPPRGRCSGGLVKAKQRCSEVEIRNIGNAFCRWLDDNREGLQAKVGVAALACVGESSAVDGVDVESYQPVSFQVISQLLHPSADSFYMQYVPSTDCWRQPLEFRIRGAPGSPLDLMIRGPGCDGKFDATKYSVGPFVGTDYSQDIVWVSGSLVRWPSRNLARRPGP